MRLTLSLILFVSGCATMGTQPEPDYSRFQSATMCLQSPTKMYRDANIGVCWFMMGDQVITASCDGLKKITYCPTQPAATQDPKDEKKEEPTKK